MNKELQDKLYSDFHDLFQEKDLDMTQTCMCWGIECGDGWEPIIRSMCVMIVSRNRHTARLKGPFTGAFDLYTRLTDKAKPILRLLEKIFQRPKYSWQFPAIMLYEIFPGWGVRFTQIKEKFGTLRVYYDVYNKYTEEDLQRFDKKSVEIAEEHYIGFLDGVISYTEYLSSKTCENDSNPGSLSRHGWWRTLCTKCSSESSKTQKQITDV
jgi:hypothetical protein